tara:strand:+ start:911 stop:1402 length:492 start_codon:yes stop_codon:yes gene_type:complete
MYYFEYDKNGYLIKYVETESEAVYSGISISDCYFHCTIKGDFVQKYEEGGLFKTISKYNGPIKLTQSFSEGESWIKVFKKNTEKKIKRNSLYECDNSHKYTNYPWVTYSADTSLENYIKEYAANINEYAIPISVISLEGESLSHLNFKIKNSFLDKWNNLIDF